MKKLYFITGNKDKFEEGKRMLGDIVTLEMLDIDLPEIQSLDSHEVIKAKLERAYEHHDGSFVVDDNSLVIKSLGSLPGPLIKWFMKSLDLEGIVNLAQKYDNQDAYATVMLGYSEGKDAISFYEGRIEGKIVMPRGEYGFGWDKIFELETGTTRAELPDEERDVFSPRRIAFEKLRDYLTSEG